MMDADSISQKIAVLEVKYENTSEYFRDIKDTLKDVSNDIKKLVLSESSMRNDINAHSNMIMEDRKKIENDDKRLHKIEEMASNMMFLIRFGKYLIPSSSIASLLALLLSLKP